MINPVHAMPMPDDFNPNAAEPVERCCPTCGFDPDAPEFRMSEAQRRLLVWCGIMLVRDTPLTEVEAEEIDQLIADARSPLPKIVWDTPNSGRVVE